MNSIFSANEPTLGYLYQIRYGLLLIVSQQTPELKLLIEQLDDISIETPNSLDVYQTKSHIKSVANLTDASPDLWKTIRVWSEGVANGTLNLDHCIFNLITTAKASDGTIPFKLKHGIGENRDIDSIQKSLVDVAATSSSQTNKAAYDAFNALADDQQKKLINRIYVMDGAVNLDQAKEGIKKKLCYTTIRERIEPLYERLEGWFVNEVILQLQNQRQEITGKEVQDKILDIADSLKKDNLPADFTVSIADDESQLSSYRNQTFVKQLEVVGINSKLINHAISDYYRAFSQKSKWMREGLINPADEIEYDGKLIDDWGRKFAILDDCSGKGEETKKTEGKRFYESHYVKNYPNIHIKDRFKEQYMVTGSCQILADKRKIGWHPDFQTMN